MNVCYNLTTHEKWESSTTDGADLFDICGSYYVKREEPDKWALVDKSTFGFLIARVAWKTRLTLEAIQKDAANITFIFKGALEETFSYSNEEFAKILQHAPDTIGILRKLRDYTIQYDEDEDRYQGENCLNFILKLACDDGIITESERIELYLDQ